jgi:hypothetical protein
VLFDRHVPEDFFFFSRSGCDDEEEEVHEVDVLNEQVTCHLMCGTIMPRLNIACGDL